MWCVIDMLHRRLVLSALARLGHVDGQRGVTGGKASLREGGGTA